MKKALTLLALVSLAGAGCTASTSVDTSATANPNTNTPTQPSNPAPATGNTGATSGTAAANLKLEADANLGGLTKIDDAKPAPTSSNGNIGLKANANAGLQNLVPTKKVATAYVPIKFYTFLTKVLTVTKGDQVVFTNDDSDAHTVTADNGAFASPKIEANASYTLDTSKLAPGTYAYHCTIHSGMNATLIVK